MKMSLPPVPPELKCVQHYLKIAESRKECDTITCYWGRLCALEKALKLPGERSKEVTDFLLAVMTWLEQAKDTSTEDGVKAQLAGMAQIEQDALKIFNAAHARDQQGIYDKTTIETFYKAWVMFDIIEYFGAATSIENVSKHAKCRAAYLNKCLKTGEVPVPTESIPNTDENLEGTGQSSNQSQDSGTSQQFIDNPAPMPSPVTPAAYPQDVVSGFSQFETNDIPQQPTTSSGTTTPPGIDPQIIQKAQKYCKYASSALNYDDVKTAVENLRQALQLLEGNKI